MLENLEKMLPASPKKIKELKKEWRRLLMPELKALARDVSPFRKSKAKPLFGANLDKRNPDNISIFGMHPNVAEDPQYYSELPKEGFFEGRPTVAPIGGIGQKKAYGSTFRTIRKHQEHLKTLGRPLYGDHAKSMTDFFMHNGRVYGIYDEENFFPVYSIRSLAELVKDDPELESVIESTFLEALKRI